MKKTVQTITLSATLLLALCPLGLSAMEQIKPPLWLYQADKALKNPINFCATVFKIAKTHQTAEWYTKNSKYPLHEAIIQNEDLAVIKELVNTFNFDVNQTNENEESPLAVAISSNRSDVLEFLIKKGADITMRTVDGDTLLHSASISATTDILECLIAHGAKSQLEDKSNYFGKTPFSYACFDCAPLKNLCFLLKNGANIDAQDKNGRTPLFFATAYGKMDLVKFLVTNGANIHLQDVEKETIIQTARTATNVFAPMILAYLNLATDLEAVCNKTMTFAVFAQRYFTLPDENQAQINVNDTCTFVLHRGTYQLFEQLFEHPLCKPVLIKLTKEIEVPVNQIKQDSNRWYLRIINLAAQCNNIQLCHEILADKIELWGVVKNIVLGEKNIIDSTLQEETQYFKKIWDTNTRDQFKKDIQSFLETQTALDGTVWLQEKKFDQNKLENLEKYDYKKDFAKNTKDIKQIVKIPNEITAHVLGYLGNNR